MPRLIGASGLKEVRQVQDGQHVVVDDLHHGAEHALQHLVEAHPRAEMDGVPPARRHGVGQLVEHAVDPARRVWVVVPLLETRDDGVADVGLRALEPLRVDLMREPGFAPEARTGDGGRHAQEERDVSLEVGDVAPDESAVNRCGWVQLLGHRLPRTATMQSHELGECATATQTYKRSAQVAFVDEIHGLTYKALKPLHRIEEVVMAGHHGRGQLVITMHVLDEIPSVLQGRGIKGWVDLLNTQSKMQELSR
ncbi:hypothetical protein PG989_015670 [Apiospora arundinis]